MYFTNTPSLNSMEAMMKRPPGGIQRGGGRNRSPYKYTGKDCDCRFCLYYRIKRRGCEATLVSVHSGRQCRPHKGFTAVSKSQDFGVVNPPD